MSVTPSCAMTVPSTSSTIECMTLSGWMSTSMSSGVTEKRCMASMNSRPLFIIVAESTLIFAPMLQFGCAMACAGVTSFVSSRVLPRKGPPEPVSRIFFSSPGRRPVRHWKMALCSESTGTISAPHSCALRMTISPAQTSVSLFARQMRLPFSMASSVGFKPTAPETAVTTASLSEMTAASVSACSPLQTLMSVSARAVRSSLAAASSVTPTMAGCSFLACCSASWILRLVVIARTRRPRCSATATV